RFGGDDRLTADYLRDAVLDSLDDDRLDFLRGASVLDTLTGPACDRVLGRTGSGAVLRELSRSNTLVAPLDSTDTAFRCHPVLAQMLRAELGRSQPGREAELHRRAGAWCAAEGDLDRAIEHGLAGDDLQRVGELIWTASSDRVLNGRRAEVRRWLDRCGRERIAAIPALALTEAALQLAGGERDLVEHWAATAEDRLAGDAPRSVRAGIAVMHAAVAREGLAVMDADAAHASTLVAEGSPWRALCCALRGVAAHLLDDPAAARDLLEDGARRGAIGAPGVQALCLAQLALLALDDGDRDDAPLLASRALAQVERHELDRDAACALVYAVSALVRSQRDRVESAREDLERAAVLLALADPVPWYDVEVRIVIARAALRLGDVTRARDALGEAERRLPRAGGAVVLARWLDDLRAQIEAFALTALIGPSSLTTAELRVLRVLPTHLSFREIGRHLHVSANTVKTHAHAIYRKLDVCSRSEAVARAYETGLLDHDLRSPSKEDTA
ncbi:MAG TPA: LuxR C-terminal-related transcriptional regulator, partial [Solirubrobacteraceae bacterium]|nr:LuxR C-terminal-related transcriptional regulator [Solirubrobacteraceae bacterium]